MRTLERCATWLIPLTSLLVALRARAEDAKPAVPREPVHILSLEPSVGVGTPLGWIGGSVVVTPIERLALHAGVGLGTQRMQIGAGARVRVVKNLALGAGWSSGSYAEVGSLTWLPSIGVDSDIRYIERAHFLNLEVSTSHRFNDRLVGRAFAGTAILLNRGDAYCASMYCHDDPAHYSFLEALPLVPYAGVAVDVGLL